MHMSLSGIITPCGVVNIDVRVGIDTRSQPQNTGGSLFDSDTNSIYFEYFTLLTIREPGSRTVCVADVATASPAPSPYS